MARFSVQMTFAAPKERAPSPYRKASVLLPRGGTAHYVLGDGRIAVTAVVREESAAAAALRLCRAVEREESLRGRGPVRVLSWTARRSVPVLAGLGRRRQQWSGGEWPDDGDDGGTAGVREPRRPRPSPGSMTAALAPPEEPWGRFPG
jgi:hypothetical protein